MKIRLQQDAYDCSLVVIQGFHNFFYNNWINFSDLKSSANFSENGINILEIKKIASKFGMKTKSYEGDFNSFIKLKKRLFTFVHINKKRKFVSLHNSHQNKKQKNLLSRS